ncbi:MAG: hypothetical protein H7039_19660 [Bryobacteraceae bacterium]|nr:hypothetical protein [Bryobacteraceae bacterium]
MSALASAPPDDLQKLVSTHNLPLVGLPAIDTKSKFFSYTVSSQGVLADVKYGGLKKDLSIAFENSAVFSSVFPADKPDKYILVDPLKRPTELATGYIHWGIFRDYYNLKKQLTIAGATPALAPTMFEKKGLVPDTAGASATDLFSTGQLGPHAMAANTTVNQPKQPYGAFPVSQTKGGNPSSYVFNPISPILSSLQQNAWVSPGDTPGKLKTNVQLFTSHYNPYNVNLMMDGNNSAASVGPRVHNYPQVLFTVSGTTTINRTPGLAAELQAHAGDKVKLEPGRSHVMGFKSNVEAGLEKDGSTYTNNVASIATQSVFKNHAASVTGPVTLTFEFVQTGPVIMHGMDENPGGKEVTQVFFSPFSWDSILAFPGVTGPRPGKRFTVSASQLGLNTRVSLGYQLRTTKESGSGAIRPLVDANVRALWSNPRWDSPLNLPLLAAYSAEGSGEVTQAIPQMQPTTGGQGFSYWGNSHDATGSDRVVLFDVPRRDLVSIGQLQHANAGRFSYEPTYIAGNSYANIRIPLDSWKASITDTFSSTRSLPWAISGNFNLYDASYLINETLFDSYTFTTIPQTNDDFAPGGLQGNAATYSGLLAGTLQLPNPRYLPYKPAGSNFTESKLKELGNADAGSFFHNAGHILVDGSFNVNSTSVDAWEAFLSGTHKLKVHKINDSGTLDGFHAPTRVRFPRAASHLSDGMSTTSIDDSYWTGFRELEQTEVRQIATEVVNQVRQRGPFLNLGDFVNRKLQSTDLGKSGALQAALDLTVNKGLDASYELPAGHATFDNIPVDSTQGSGFPGQLLQGDVLQTLAPYMSVRSDTFTIRAYGEARDSSNRPTARVWCEAVVQRLPDPMPSTSGSGSATQELAKPTSTFGRRFNILSFRWLHPQEI